MTTNEQVKTNPKLEVIADKLFENPTDDVLVAGEHALVTARMAGDAIGMVVNPNPEVREHLAETAVEQITEMIEEAPGFEIETISPDTLPEIYESILGKAEQHLKTQANGAIIALKESVRFRDEKIIDLGTQNAELAAELARTKVELHASSSDREKRLAQQLEMSDQEIDALETRLAESDEEKRALRSDNAALQRQLRELTAQLESARADARRASALEAQNAVWRQMVVPDDALREKVIQDKQAETVAVRAQLSETEAALAQANAKIERMREGAPMERAKQRIKKIARRILDKEVTVMGPSNPDSELA